MTSARSLLRHTSTDDSEHSEHSAGGAYPLHEALLAEVHDVDVVAPAQLVKKDLARQGLPRERFRQRADEEHSHTVRAA